MHGETNLSALLKTLKPGLNPGAYVFCMVNDLSLINPVQPLMQFKEEEGFTVILRKEDADTLNLEYTFVAAWITLTVHSALEAVGLTAAFSNALTAGGISCNVVAAFYHDHIFVAEKDAEKAMDILHRLSQ